MGGFNLVLGIGAAVAALGALNTFAISALVTGVEKQRAAEMAAAAAHAAATRAIPQPAE